MDDYKTLISGLRNKKSRDNRTLLNTAADAIEQLVKERDAAVADMKEFKLCEACKHFGGYPMNIPCRECSLDAGNNFEWRGITDETR